MLTLYYNFLYLSSFFCIATVHNTLYIEVRMKAVTSEGDNAKTAVVTGKRLEALGIFAVDENSVSVFERRAYVLYKGAITRLHRRFPL